MTIIEIIPSDNGSHRNQTASASIAVPEGWAVVPEELETDNFPFGEVEVEEINGVMTVTRWTAGEIPEPEPEPEAEPTPTITERVASLEATKAERADVDELQEALDMILTGVTE